MTATPTQSAWRVVIVSAIVLAMSTGTVVVYGFSVFLKPLTQEFHWSRSQASIAVSLLNLMVCLGSPAAGRLADRLGGRAVNVHFSDGFGEGELQFDYTMRPGVVPHGNGLALMRAVGLRV